jgi:hypothetical protein
MPPSDATEQFSNSQQNKDGASIGGSMMKELIAKKRKMNNGGGIVELVIINLSLTNILLKIVKIQTKNLMRLLGGSLMLANISNNSTPGS